MVAVMTRRLLVAVVLVLLGAGPAVAGEPTERLRIFFDRANRIILAPEPDGGVDDRVLAVRAVVNEIFDFDGAAALALGRHWEPLPPPARAAFTRLYADVIERAYLAWVGGKARVGEGGVTVRWLDEAVEDDAATVSSVLLTRAGGEFPIEYRMVRRGNDWLVRDVVVDGLSLAANYHMQFERVLQMGSYDELVDRLREKAGPVARAQATASAVRAMVAAPAPVGPPPRVVPPAAADSPSVAAVIVAEVREPVSGMVVSDAAPSVPVQPAPMLSAAPSRSLTASPRPAGPAPLALAAPPRSETPTARPIAARTPPTARREFWVQVGAFHTTDAATRLVQRLRRHAVTIAMGGDRQGLLARVLVGPFAERAAAASTVRALQANGLTAFIAGAP
jgi:phospholipid transport system substrate-binding protein